MTLYSVDPCFGFESDIDSDETILLTQKLFNAPEAAIRLYPHDAKKLITQLTILLERLKTGEIV